MKSKEWKETSKMSIQLFKASERTGGWTRAEGEEKK